MILHGFIKKAIAFFLLSMLISIKSYAVLDDIKIGDSFYFPKTTKVYWNSIEYVQCTGYYTPVQSCLPDTRVYTGNLTVEYTISLGIATANMPVNMNNTSTGANASSALRTNGAGIGHGNVISAHPQPGLSCSYSLDKGSFQACLSRYQGSTFKITGNITFVLPSTQWNLPLCSDVDIYPTSFVISPNPFSGRFASSYSCTPGGENVTPLPDPDPESICSLNSQNLNLNYSSTNLNVDGLTQNTYLVVSCSSGDAKDYQLKLTGSNVTNGRLDFDNGVSAQVSLNGIQVQANGPGIQLNNLISQTIPVSATLTGTAAASGVSKTTVILVLEAL